MLQDMLNEVYSADTYPETIRRFEDIIKNLLARIKDLRTTDELNHDPPAVLKAHNAAVNTLKNSSTGVPNDE